MVLYVKLCFDASEDLRAFVNPAILVVVKFAHVRRHLPRTRASYTNMQEIKFKEGEYTESLVRASINRFESLYIWLHDECFATSQCYPIPMRRVVSPLGSAGGNIENILCGGLS